MSENDGPPYCILLFFLMLTVQINAIVMPSGGWTLFFCVTSYKAIGVPKNLEVETLFIYNQLENYILKNKGFLTENRLSEDVYLRISVIWKILNRRKPDF